MTAYITLGALLAPQVLVGVYLLFAATQRNLARQWWSGRPLPFFRTSWSEGEEVWLGKVFRQSRAACRVHQVDTGLEARKQRYRLGQTDRLAMMVSAGYDVAAMLLLFGAVPLLAYDSVWLVMWVLGHASALPMTPAAGLGGLAATVAFVVIELRWYFRQAGRAEAHAQQYLGYRTCTILLSQCWELHRGSGNELTELLPRFGEPAGLDLNANVFLCELGEWAAQGYPTLNPARVREVREHVARVQNAIHQALGAVLRAEPDALGHLVSLLAHVQLGLYRGTWLRLLDETLLPQGDFELITRRRNGSRRREAWIVLGAGVVVTGAWVGAAALGERAAAGAMVTALLGAVPLLFSTRRLSQDARSALTSIGSASPPFDTRP